MNSSALKLILALCLLLSVMQSWGIGIFQFDRAAIIHGEYWRVLTAHFIHLNNVHLLLNMLGLILVLMLFDGLLTVGQWLAAIIISALMISVLIFLCLPWVEGYVGLSGVIHTLYVVGTIQLLKQPKDRYFGVVLALLVTLKLLTENLGQGISLTANLIGGHVLVQSHLFGALVGVFVAQILSLLRHNPPEKANNSDI